MSLFELNNWGGGSNTWPREVLRNAMLFNANSTFNKPSILKKNLQQKVTYITQQFMSFILVLSQ